MADLGERLVHQLEVSRLDALPGQGVRHLESEARIVTVDGNGIGEGGEPDGLVQLLAEDPDDRFPQLLLLDHQQPHVFPRPELKKSL